MCMLQKIFGFNKQTMNLRTEIIAGITTFLTMSYILAVNPAMLSTTGMDKGAIFTATALAAAIATLLLAWMAKLPFAQAPGYGAECFLCFYLSAGYGLFLGNGIGSHVCRRAYIYIDYVVKCQRNNTE